MYRLLRAHRRTSTRTRCTSAPNSSVHPRAHRRTSAHTSLYIRAKDNRKYKTTHDVQLQCYRVYKLYRTGSTKKVSRNLSTWDLVLKISTRGSQIWKRFVILKYGSKDISFKKNESKNKCVFTHPYSNRWDGKIPPKLSSIATCHTYKHPRGTKRVEVTT